MGIASLVLGIVSLISGIIPVIGSIAIIPAILGLVFGIIDLVNKNRTQDRNKGMSIVGIILSSIAVVIVLFWLVTVAFSIIIR